jgi:hypothetical protein
LPQRPQHRRCQRRRCIRRYAHDGTAQLHDNCTSRRRRPFRLNHKLRKTSRVSKHLPAPAINLARPQVGSPCNLGNVRAGLRYRRYQRLLLLFRPSPSALHARHYRYLTHRTVSNTGANTSACTSAISDYPINPARRPLTEAYQDGELQIDVRGELAGILNLSLKRKKPAEVAGNSQVSMVAGVGFEPTTFRL